MSVYKHEQGTYRSYRVARSVDGKLRQAYFPRTRKGLQSARELDELWSKEQETAQQHFTGPALRWRKKAPTRARKTTKRTTTTAQKRKSA